MLRNAANEHRERRALKRFEAYNILPPTELYATAPPHSIGIRKMTVLPPRCRLISREEGITTLQPGEITFSVLARAETNEPGRRIHASIGLARPADPGMYGYIAEHHGFGMTSDQSGEYSEDLAATMLASTLGIEFDPGAAWNERKKLYVHSQLIIDSLSITASAQGNDSGLWTCAVAAAVFRF